MWTQTLTVRFPWSADPEALETVEIEAGTLVQLDDFRRSFKTGYCVADAPDRWGIWPLHRRAVMVSASEPVRD